MQNNCKEMMVGAGYKRHGSFCWSLIVIHGSVLAFSPQGALYRPAGYLSTKQ